MKWRHGLQLWVAATTAAIAIVAVSAHAHAHVSEQGIVLLLPTKTYIISGCLAVIFSMLVVTVLPHHWVFALFSTKKLPADLLLNFLPPPRWREALKDFVSIASMISIAGLVIIGMTGSRDPLVNLLPLAIWTFFWILLYLLHCLLGNIWAWLNPWTGIWQQVARNPKRQSEGLIPMPDAVGQWPAIGLYVLFYWFIIVDIAPDDPLRLAWVVCGYVLFNFAGIFLFGLNPWLHRVECFSVLFGLLARLAPIQYDQTTRQWRLGLPGWKLMQMQASDRSISQAFFLLTVLACGSFDGVNETFWWLAKIGVNPLEFPGRSAVMIPSTLGIMAAILVVFIIFAGVVSLSLYLVDLIAKDSPKQDLKKYDLFTAMALTVLPISAAYHGSHYFVSSLLNVQYLIAALSDPLANGSNLLGLANYHVTTGYLGEIASVRRIWLTQAAMVVAGHILAVLMAHGLIAKYFPSPRQAIAAHLPIAVFMAAYTWFGLWLLAAPKGA